MKSFRQKLGLLMTIFLVLLMTVSPLAAELDYSLDSSNYLEDSQETVVFNSTKQKTGWFTQNGYRYYRMPNGKLCTEQFVKIGKNYYSFDSKGRMRTGLVTFSKTDKAYFSKTYGNFTNYVKVLKVVRKNNGSVIAKDANGVQYIVNLKKIVDQGQKEIPESRIKKNSVIHVIYRDGILETYPKRFENAYKVRLIQ